MVDPTIYKLFISHANEDRAMANMLHDQAVARGATAYVDTKYLHAGMYFKKELITQIKTSDEMLILLSPRQYFDQLETRVKGKLMRGNHIRVMQENISRALQSDAEEQS
ncbi:MAG: toll/interleukin-1 receptor domain-containing protein [Fimbriimonadaceae bacterium]